MAKRDKPRFGDETTDVREPLESSPSRLSEGGGQDQRDDFQRSGLSESGGQDWPERFRLLADAIEVIHGEPTFLGKVEARRRVEREISRRLFATGFLPKDVIRIEPQLEAAAWEIVEYIAGSPTIRPDDEVVSEQIDRVVDYLTRVYSEHLAKFPGDLFRQTTKVIEDEGDDSVEYRKLPEGIVTLLEERLRKEGMSEAEAASYARSTVENFQAAGGRLLEDPDQAKAAADFAAAAVLATRGAAANFEQAAKIALPPRAPKVWANHEDRLPGENVVDFLNRVWGPYRDALFQSDIKALGDPGLVPAVRAYCHRHNIDPASVLPPPKKARLDRALAEVEPDSPAAAILQGRLRNREALARRRKGGQPKL